MRARVSKGVTIELALRSHGDGWELFGVERRRRWSKDEKARIVEETLLPGAVVSEVARRHDVAQSLLFAWRRRARVEEPGGRDGSILLPVEIGSIAAPSGPDAARQTRAATRSNKRSPASSKSSLAPGDACGSTVRL